MISEENIEFIDWSKIPIKYITPNIVEKYGSSFYDLKCRLFLENTFSKLEIKHSNNYSDWIFFFSEGQWYIHYNINKKIVSISERIWRFLRENYSPNTYEIEKFFKNIFSMYFEYSDFSVTCGGILIAGLEDFFKTMPKKDKKLQEIINDVSNRNSLFDNIFDFF